MTPGNLVSGMMFSGGFGWRVTLVMLASCHVCWAADDALVVSQLQRNLDRHCADCHSGEAAEGDIRIDHILSLNSGGQAELLARIEEQVYLRQMPPKDDCHTRSTLASAKIRGEVGIRVQL